MLDHDKFEKEFNDTHKSINKVAKFTFILAGVSVLGGIAFIGAIIWAIVKLVEHLS